MLRNTFPNDNISNLLTEIWEGGISIVGGKAGMKEQKKRNISGRKQLVAALTYLNSIAEYQ